MDIILDFDNTMGLSKRDVDDGLTLLYLLGRGDVNIKLITTSFGNDGVDEVYENTKGMLRDLKVDIPLVKGRNIHSSPFENKAAKEIINLLRKKPDTTIIALGSLTNLADAEKLSPGTLKDTRIISMGGLREELLVNGVHLDELNYSCDYESCRDLLKASSNFTNVDGNFCLNIAFSKKEEEELNKDIKIYSYIRNKASQWFNEFNEEFGNREIIIWDLNCALYLTNPELFTSGKRRVSLNIENLKKGYLIDDEKGIEISYLKGILDRDKYFSRVFEAWKNITMD